MEDLSIAALLGRLVISLAIVLGLMTVAGRLLKRRGLGPVKGAGPTSRIEVLARHGLGRTSSVQLVRVAGRTLVLGVTDASVTVLGEADPLLLEAELAFETAGATDPVRAADAQSWGALVEFLKERTVRR